MGFTHTHKLNQLVRNNERSFPPLKLTRPLAVWQESKVSVTNFGFRPFQCVVSFRQERVVFFEVHKKISTPSTVLSPVKLTLIKTKTQFFLSDQIVVIFRHGLVISFSGNELIREVHYSSTNLFL